ncbi:MAG: Mut7-C RNAse domain-containing protein [Thermodesulfobacteriota bacterium]
MDRSLGRLARWLRLLGLDAAFDSGMQDETLLRLAGEGRIVITRTRSVAARLGPEKAVWIGANSPLDQLAQAARSLGLSLDPGAVFTRCLSCNREVLPLDRDNARSRVPDYVFRTAESFSACPVCGRVFWKGTHRDRALALVRKALRAGSD